jgi:hypothetical protein
MARLTARANERDCSTRRDDRARVFHELLHAVSPVADETLQQGLKQLMEVELVYQRGLVPQATYLFKHALIQDTAYHSLLKSKRQHYHQRIAQVLEERFLETKETQPELLAHHYTEAGLSAQAIPYWQKAGQSASLRSANIEATAHLTKGWSCSRPCRIRLNALSKNWSGNCPVWSTDNYQGLYSPGSGKSYTRALELCR